jgi:hypothetical protein
VLQESKWELATSADPIHATGKGCHRLIQVFRAAIGKFLPFDIAPERLHRIQVWRITGKPFYSEPTVLVCQVALHDPTPVCGQPVPDQNHFLATQGLFEILQEGHQALRVVAAWTGSKEQTRALTVPAIAYGRADRDLGPIEGMNQDRRLAFRGPRSSDGGPL